MNDPIWKFDIRQLIIKMSGTAKMHIPTFSHV